MDMKNLNGDTVLALMGSFAAAAIQMPDVRKSEQYWYKEYSRYQKWNKALRAQLDEQGINPVDCPSASE